MELFSAQINFLKYFSLISLIICLCLVVFLIGNKYYKWFENLNVSNGSFLATATYLSASFFASSGLLYLVEGFLIPWLERPEMFLGWLYMGCAGAGLMLTLTTLFGMSGGRHFGAGGAIVFLGMSFLFCLGIIVLGYFVTTKSMIAIGIIRYFNIFVLGVIALNMILFVKKRASRLSDRLEMATVLVPIFLFTTTINFVHHRLVELI